MSCNNGDKKKSTYTGSAVGDFNYTGDLNYVAGGPLGSGLSAGTTIVQTIPNGLNRRPWARDDAKMDDKLLDAAYPTIELQWFVEIELEPGSFFRLSDKPFYVQDANGDNRYYDPRVEQPPTISITVGEWLNPNYETSDATFQINNRDGFFNEYLPGGNKYRNWSGAKVVVKVGFGEKYENYFTLFEGQVTVKAGLTSDRDSITVKAYDKLDIDEVPMPPRVYTKDTYPDLDTSYAGKGIPLIYGDWTEDVPDSGSILGVCLNANENLAPSYVFKISDVELESVTEVYLHRGSRKEGDPGGPIKIDISQIEVRLTDGTIVIPRGVDVLLSEITYGNGSQSATAGVGSGADLITANDTSVNFVEQKIQVGDKVVKTKTGETSFVTNVLATQLQLSGGFTYAQGDEYKVFTRKYAFIKSDKISVKCKGKKLGLVSVDRISEISPDIKLPTGIAFSVQDRTLWIADDQTQSVYNTTFDKQILKTIPYTDIDAGLTEVSSIDVGSDLKLFVTSAAQSRVFRFDPVSGGIGYAYYTTDIVGIAALKTELTGVAAQADNKFWLFDNATGDFWLIDPFSAVQPFVDVTFNRSVFAALATDIQDISHDSVHNQLVVSDRATQTIYRISATDGTLVSSFSTDTLAVNADYVIGVTVAQDESVFYMDQGTLTIYNYNEQADASSNPAFIARDILQKFGGHTYEEFDISWNDTARQLSVYKSRAALQDKANLISYINKLLAQYNVVFHLRFGMFGLYYIDFQNFRTTCRLVTEKDIKENSFRPQKEMNQYFNSMTASYNYRPFDSSKQTSDTYVSSAGVSFAGREVNKTLDLPNLYRRADLDRLVPLLVKLAVPEPEFVDVTMGFRVIRTQMHDFLTVHFDGDVDCATGLKDSGRRYNHVPCMVRKLQYNLGEMSVTMKLWSLLSTAFPGWTPPGRTVGGVDDIVVLSNLGRLGRISPVGDILSSPAVNQLQIADEDGQNAENRTASPAGLCWANNYTVDVVDGATKEILQTFTIQAVSGQVMTFLEDITATITPTVRNAAGFITSGTYLQYAAYNKVTTLQKGQFASLSPPVDNYPKTNTDELEEQRSGKHAFDDGGIPYVIYPLNFIQY